MRSISAISDRVYSKLLVIESSAHRLLKHSDSEEFICRKERGALAEHRGYVRHQGDFVLFFYEY